MLHPLAYHRLVRYKPELMKAFWFPVRDDRFMGASLTRFPPQPPARLAGVGAALVVWRPCHG